MEKHFTEQCRLLFEGLGHPRNHQAFCTLYKEHFPGSYEQYTSMENERLFSVKPRFIQTWIYEKGEPFIQRFDFQNRT